MKKAFDKKAAASYTIIGGADGPTSVFMAGGYKQKGLAGIKNAIRKWRYQKKRKKAIKQIKANPHSIEEVIQYMNAKYRAVEIADTSKRYVMQKKNCKAELVRRYQPELLGESLEIERPDIKDEQEVKDFIKKVDEQQKRAENVSEDIFPMDYHIYRIKIKNVGKVYFEIEKNRDCFSATSSEAKNGRLKYLEKIVKDIYMYYGVSEQDILEETERYKQLVAVLAD